MSAWDAIRTRIPPTEVSLPRHGRIRLGEKVATSSGGERPSKVDYFKVDADDNGTTLPTAAEAFKRVYPGRPRTIRAWLPGSTPDDCFTAGYRLYGTSGLKRKCTGPPGAGTAMQRLADGTLQACKCECDKLPEKSPLACKFTWQLLLLLPDVSAGVWDIVSSSEIGWRRIEGELKLLHDLTGDLHLLEVDVVLLTDHVNPKGVPSTVHTVSVRATGTARELATGTGGRFVLDPAAAALPPGTVIPARYELPPSRLEEEPDALIHHDQIAPAGPTGSAAGSGPPPAAPASQPGSPLEGGREAAAGGEGPSIADQLRSMSDADRAELRERVPIPDGAKSSEVSELLGSIWSANLALLLLELRARNCTFEELGIADPWRSFSDALREMSKDDRAELRRRCSPIFDEQVTPAVVEALGLRWSLDLPGLLRRLRERDCTFAEFVEATAAADRFQEQVHNDTLPPSESQERAMAGNPDVGEQVSMYGPGSPS